MKTFSNGFMNQLKINIQKNMHCNEVHDSDFKIFLRGLSSRQSRLSNNEYINWYSKVFQFGPRKLRIQEVQHVPERELNSNLEDLNFITNFLLNSFWTLPLREFK